MRISDWSSDVCSSDLQLQVGDAATGDRALVAAMRAFRLPAAKIPFADWPRQFWTLLLATPELREQPQAPSWGSGFCPLAGVGRGPRAALLLRLVAGLPEAAAAAVLGVHGRADGRERGCRSG